MVLLHCLLSKTRATSVYPEFVIVFVLVRAEKYIISLKTVDTIGNCQRLVFTVGVSQHTHKKKKPVKI